MIKMCSGCRAKTEDEKEFNIIWYIKGKNTIITCVCNKCKEKIRQKYQIVKEL